MPVTESASWLVIKTVPYKTMTLDEVCRRGGFASEHELRSLLLRVPVESWLQSHESSSALFMAAMPSAIIGPIVANASSGSRAPAS